MSIKVNQSSRTDRKGVQIVGAQFERAGYIFREQTTSDYGIDAQIELIDKDEVTGKLIALQIKSGPSWFQEEHGGGFIFRGDNEHLHYWLEHSLPVIIVLCNIEDSQCFWQVVTPINIIKTPKAWKINIPKYQRINAGMDVDLKRLVNKLPIHNSYTIGSIDDVSHGSAKRYSLRIILNREHTQAEIIDLIKKITSEATNCEYHRSNITRNHWRNQPAHVVWLYIYPSTEDESNNNFICQSEWFSESLQSEYLPMSNGGEEISSNTRVLWNDGYLITSRFNTQHTVTKEEFILQITDLVELTKPLISAACTALEHYQSSRINFETLKTRLVKKYKEIDEVYNSGTDTGLSPYECKDISTKFQSLIAHAHNLYLPFGNFGNSFDEERTIFNINSQAQSYDEALKEFEFELKKVV